MWKEVDLFSRWFPLCKSSSTIASQGRVELLAHIEMGAGSLPLGKRDAVMCVTALLC